MSEYKLKGVEMSEVDYFHAYVESFYGNVPDAIYPIGATYEMIVAATGKYIDSLCVEPDSPTWGGGDSIDRERVRDIMINDFKLEWK